MRSIIRPCGVFGVSNAGKDTPAYSYFDSLWTTPLNWDFYTVAQPNADDREINWPRGKVLGGLYKLHNIPKNKQQKVDTEI